jgi:hypothetical protein
MGAMKGKFRFLRMIEAGLPPRRREMAGTAVLAKAIRMDIIAGMASRAGLRQLSFAGRPAMTSDTGRFGMRATKPEVALSGVIEVFAFPGCCRVAVNTGGSKSPGMGIIDCMTRIAVLWRALVLLGDMTPGTACHFMRAGQWIFRLRVIESFRLPAGLFVTFAAVVGHRVAMNIVGAMTRDTIAGCISPGDFGPMAICATRRLMSTTEHIIRLRMVESSLREPLDVSTTTFVVGMAAATLAIRGQRASTMKTLAAVAVVGHQLVAGQTESSLGIVLEGEMTGAAILLELRMSFDQLSWHHHTLPIDRRRGSSSNRCDEECREDHEFSADRPFVWSRAVWSRAIQNR